MAVIDEVRRDKAERKMPLNTPIKKLTIYAGTQKSAHVLNQATQDIEGTCKTQALVVLAEKGDGREVHGYPAIRLVAEY
jgi:valyl-tRNA synthetase